MRRLVLTLLFALAACDPGAPGDKGDGVGDVAVDADGDGVPADEDCDDDDDAVFPGNDETPYNGVDDDCDDSTPDDDLDGDGAAASIDCDDGDAGILPGAAELCDGVDNDCDGEIDEDAEDADLWFADLDGDGHGDAGSATAACSQPSGHVADDTDCDDADAASFPGGEEVCDAADNDCDGDVDEGVQTTFFGDADGDGHGVPDTTTLACTVPDGFSALEDDCDDTDADVSPSTTEICDGRDDDCDGTVDEADAADASRWYADVDEDGYGDAATYDVSCDAPSGYVADDADCDDTDASLNPETVWYADSDSDGYGDVSSTAVQCAQPGAHVRDASDCDDTDASLNPETVWYADDDGDGYGDASSTQTQCAEPSDHVRDGADCDDTDAAVNPDSVWFTDGDGDGYGDASGAGTTVCVAPASTVLDNTDCDDTDATLNPETVWYADDDGDGYGDAASTTAQCAQPSDHVRDATDCDDGDAEVNPDSVWFVDDDGDGYGDADDPGEIGCNAPSDSVLDDSDCDDADASISPGEDEVCNEVDDDCDGSIDESDATDASTWYADSDGDGYGDASATSVACEQPTDFVSDATDCDDTDAAVSPAATEQCDGQDTDCDGTTDESAEVYGDASACAGTSCDDILSVRTSASDGVYSIDPDGSGAFDVECDMTTDGGGWTLVVIGDSTEIAASDPPDFNYNSTVWTAGYGSAGDATHVSEAWLRTPAASELMWVEGSTVVTESVTPATDLGSWAKTSGTIKLNTQLSSSYGPYGGRVFATYVSAICNTGNGSTSWGRGFGAVRSCQHSYPTLYYEMSTYPSSIQSMSLWVR